MSHELSYENSIAKDSPDRGQLLLGLLIVLALVSSVIMLIADSGGALKIALVAALWAAIIGFFLVYRSRKEVDRTQAELHSQEAVHEAELRTVLAEKEAEQLRSEREHQENLRSQDQRTLAEIRDQLAEMRTQLAELSGREWGYEPAVLQAEARRILELESERGGYNQPAAADPEISETPIPEESAIVEVVLPEPPVESSPTRSRHRASEMPGGRRRRDENSTGVSVADLIAATRKRGRN